MTKSETKINKNTLICNIARIDVKINLGEMVVKIIQDFDQKQTDEQTEYISERLYQFVLQEKFQKMPWGFIAQAFERGLAGEYGSGKISVRTLYKWIDEARKSWNNSKVQQTYAKEDVKTPSRNMHERMSFLLKNIDKLPSLKAIYEQ